MRVALLLSLLAGIVTATPYDKGYGSHNYSNPHPGQCYNACITSPTNTTPETPLGTSSGTRTAPGFLSSPAASLSPDHKSNASLGPSFGTGNKASPAFPTTTTSPSPSLGEGVVPDFVISYAPFIHLSSTERWWPASVDTHLAHCVPLYDNHFVPGAPAVINSSNADFTPTDANLDKANIFYTSMDNVEDNPSWLLSPDGKPDSTGKSGSPAIIVVVDKDQLIAPGILDAFYYTFYSYNHGRINKWLGRRRVGNHVGDWEWVRIRFALGVPDWVQLSQSGKVVSFNWDDLEKFQNRPVFYAALGTHSLYPRVGSFDAAWTFGALWETTDPGPIWDLARNYNAFSYSENGFLAMEGTTQSPNFLSFPGHWGDRQYSKRDFRQTCSIKYQCHYVDGPFGPQTSDLLEI